VTLARWSHGPCLSDLHAMCLGYSVSDIALLSLLLLLALQHTSLQGGLHHDACRAGKGVRSETREEKSKHVDGLITYHPAFERDPYIPTWGFQHRERTCLSPRTRASTRGISLGETACQIGESCSISARDGGQQLSRHSARVFARALGSREAPFSKPCRARCGRPAVAISLLLPSGLWPLLFCHVMSCKRRETTT
jgi:hypothetical protein